jgi:hypothetical protein
MPVSCAIVGTPATGALADELDVELDVELAAGALDDELELLELLEPQPAATSNTVAPSTANAMRRAVLIFVFTNKTNLLAVWWMLWHGAISARRP